MPKGLLAPYGANRTDLREAKSLERTKDQRLVEVLHFRPRGRPADATTSVGPEGRGQELDRIASIVMLCLPQ